MAARYPNAKLVHKNLLCFIRKIIFQPSWLPAASSAPGWITVIPCCMVLPINTSRSCLHAKQACTHRRQRRHPRPLHRSSPPRTALAANSQQNCFQGSDALPAGVIGWRTNISGVDGKRLPADKNAPLGRPKSPRRTTVTDQDCSTPFLVFGLKNLELFTTNNTQGGHTSGI